MRVVFDLRAAQDERYPERGIPRYITGHAEALCQHAEVSQIFGIVEVERPVPAAAEILNAGGELISSRDLSRRVGMEGALVHHVTSPFSFNYRRDQLLPSAMRRPGVVRVVTLYDVIPLAFPATVPNASDRQMWAFRAEMVRSADIVLCISHFTAADAIRRLGLQPHRVQFIGAGVPDVDAATLEGMQTPPELPGLEAPFVLFAGGVDDPRKNVETLIRAFARLDAGLRNAYQLVVVSRIDPTQHERLLEAVRRAGVEDRVLITGYVSDDLLRRLFATCRCFVYPSLYEGLGLPILEAMSYGAPTIASKTTGCGEVVGHPDATFDPTDEADISAAMARVLADRKFAHTLRDYGRRRAAEYSWELVANRTVAAYRRVPPAKPTWQTRGPGRESVVFASYSVPSRASPASALLLTAASASEYVRVSFATPAPLRPREPGFRVLNSALVKPTLQWLEGPLVCLVDSPRAAELSADLLAERPGIAVLWELDQVLTEPPARNSSGAGGGGIRDLASVAEQLVVASAFDASRIRSVIGRGPWPEPVVLPPPLGWVAGGRLGHQLPLEAAILSNPKRQAVRSQRGLRLIIAARRPPLGPFDSDEVESAADLAIALSHRGLAARVQLLGTAPLEPVEQAQRRCVQAGGRLAHAEWPAFEEFVAWMTAADMFLELGGASPAASRATTDHALLAGRPALLVRHGATEAPGTRVMPSTATATELAEATTALLAATPPDRTETLRQRSPESAAKSLLAVLGIGSPGDALGLIAREKPVPGLLRAPQAGT